MLLHTIVRRQSNSFFWKKKILEFLYCFLKRIFPAAWKGKKIILQAILLRGRNSLWVRSRRQNFDRWAFIWWKFLQRKILTKFNFRILGEIFGWWKSIHHINADTRIFYCFYKYKNKRWNSCQTFSLVFLMTWTFLDRFPHWSISSWNFFMTVESYKAGSSISKNQKMNDYSSAVKQNWLLFWH